MRFNPVAINSSKQSGIELRWFSYFLPKVTKAEQVDVRVLSLFGNKNTSQHRILRATQVVPCEVSVIRFTQNKIGILRTYGFSF